MPLTEDFSNEGPEEPSSSLRRGKGSGKGSMKKLTKQSTIESEKRREMLKQESKDSGIVTEMTMSVRPKELPATSKEGERKEGAGGSKSKRSFKSKEKSDKIKRSQSVKEKRSKDKYVQQERSHDDLEIELLTPKQNGSVDDEQEKKNPSMIRGMWKKAFKTLKSSPSVEKLSKKSSFHKKKQNSKEADEEIEQLNTGPVDPVYSLLKCAADLPRSGVKSPCLTHAHGSGQHQPGYARYPSGGDSSGNTSKTSSPSSSASHSPKTRRKKLNARMKSFSLDTPEPPKQLLGIDETTKKKSSSFTNTCFGGRESPDEKVTAFSASALRKKFAFGKASSLEIEDKKQRSYSPSPKQSPKSQRKEKQSLYVALYNFKAKEKDDMDLRAGWRVSVTDSSKKDWWKGKSHGKMGYFPAAYVIPLQSEQRVFQVTQPLNLSDGNYSVKFHKDQIVFQIGEETEGMILVKAASNKQAMCPTAYLQEL